MPTKIDQFLKSKIGISSLELIVLDIPQKKVFKSAIGIRKSRKALIVKWVDPIGVIGYGECSCRPDPFYSHEFVDGAIEVISSFIFPLLQAESNYSQVINTMKNVRGWHFTKAAIEFAMNDVIRRKSGAGIIESWQQEVVNKVPVGISMGLFDNVGDLEATVTEAQESGYNRLKFKIAPGYNNKDILVAIRGINFDNISFDANGSFTANDFDLVSEYAAMGHIIEQPFAPGDTYLNDEYNKKFHPLRLCLDEDIESYGNLLSNIQIMEEVNLKPGRVGGLVESLRIIEFCQENNISVWIGGMFETGIGRAQNLQLASLLPNAKAHDLSPSSRYFEKDILVTPIEMDEGWIDRNAFNHIEVDEEAMEAMTVKKIILKK